MKRLMTKLPTARPHHGRKPRHFRPLLEALEDRVVPSGNNWAMYNFDSAGTRDNTAEHILSPANVGGLQVQWSFPTKGVVAGTPAVVGDAVYAGDTSGTFYAVSRDGQLLWQTQVNGPVTDSALVVGDTVIFGTQGNFFQNVAGTIYGLDAKTGAVLWETQPQANDPLSQIWGSATLVGHNVAIGVASGDEIVSPQPPPTSRGSVVLLNPTNGHIIWQTFTISDADFKAGATGAAVWSTPAYDPNLGLIYAGTGNNYSNPTTGNSDAMMAFNAKTGAIVWVNQRTQNDNWDNHFNSTSPDFDFGDSPHVYTLANGETVVGSGQKSGFYWVFDAANGNVVNIQPNGKQGLDVVPGSTLGGLFATAAVDRHTGVVFANAHVPTNGNNAFPATGELAAISRDGLSVLWDVPTPSADQTGVALANGVVYFQDLGGTFYAVDENTGKVLAQLFTGGANSGPAVSGGQIFLGQGNIFGHGFGSPGGIVALGLNKTAAVPFLQTNLVSDIQGMAEITDANLKNPWGVSESASSPFWVSDQGTSNSTLYAVTATSVSKVPLTVAIPKTPAGPQGPTGQVNNSTTDFKLANGRPAAFIFANLNGTISAWNGGGSATIEWTTPGAVYTGLAIGSTASGNFLYAADGAQNRIDVFNGSFTPVSLGSGAFSDPLLPSDLKLVPFGIQNIGGSIYVAYAPAGRPAQTGATEGQGAVAVFDTAGHFLRQLVIGSKLAAPWGMTMAPTGFGKFGGDLLVGNFAFNFSEVNAFDPKTGQFLGTLSDAAGNPIRNQALWYIGFGNGGRGGDPNTLYFAAGINGEKDGLFGSLQPIPSLPAKAPVVPNLPTGAKQVFSTVPPSGDQNPYGVAFVPQGIAPGGVLNPGDLLVSDFNNAANTQGTGSTIMRYTPAGGTSVFFQGQPGLGLTTALGVLKSGFVLVGSVPVDANGNPQAGALLILDSSGHLISTLSDSALLDGPWDLAINDHGDSAQVFVSNVLSGTVTRIDMTIPMGGTPMVESLTQIASGYATRPDPNALVVGPTGLVFNARTGTLYVASTGDNAIFAIPNAARTHHDHGTGHLFIQDNVHLHGPLGLVMAPNGDLIAANGDAQNPDPNQSNELVEFNRDGQFVGQFQLDKGGPGAAFGVALSSANGELRFAAVDDDTNTVDVWTFLVQRRGDGDDDGDDQARMAAAVDHVMASQAVAPANDANDVLAAAIMQSLTDKAHPTFTGLGV